MYIAGMNYCLTRGCLEIYIAGCSPPHCIGCHNPELQSFVLDNNVNSYKEKIKKKILTGMVTEVWLLGGEPLDQDLKELENFVRSIRSMGNVEIWIFTKYDDYEDRCDFLELIDYVKHGRYIESLPEYYNEEHDILIASNNQKIIKI